MKKPSTARQAWADFLFVYQVERKLSWLFWLCIGLMFIVGFTLWGIFLGWGHGPYNFHDWADITLPRLAFLQDAIQNGSIPLHISSSVPLDSVTDRFMSVPDVILSPQVLLLSLLPTESFILIDTWILYTVGFVGLLWLRKKLRLSLTSFALFFLLFNFNGHILAHISVGHLTWSVYFLFPWFIGLIFELLDGQGSWLWTIKTSLLMFLIFINGGYHHFVWALLFMGLLLVVSMQHFWILVRTIFCSIGLCAVRILPLFLPLGSFDTHFMAGYPHIATIWTSLVDIQTIPNDISLNSGMTREIGLWEFNLYIGLLGASFILFFGIYRVILNQSKTNYYPVLFLPSLGLVILSLDKVYKYLRIALPIPLITGERVASRILVLAFLFILTLALMEFQRILDQPDSQTVKKFIAIPFIILLANDLWQNFRIWQLPTASKSFEAKILDLGNFTIANHSDPNYTTLLMAGLFISLGTLGLLFYFAWRDGKRVRNKVNEVL